MKKFILILCSIIIFGCNSDKKGISYGTFNLYENESLVGTIYRVENYQLEKYLDDSELIARIEYISDSTYIVSGIEKNLTGIDTIKWLNTHKTIDKNKFLITAKPQNTTIEYEYKASLVKVDNKVPKEYAHILSKLNTE